MKVALFFHLGGDIDVLSQFLTVGPNAKPRVLVSDKLLKTNSRLSVLLDAYGVSPRSVIGLKDTSETFVNALNGCTHLLTSSESTLRPHKLANLLVETANEMGLVTATLQHGVENIGLSYFDDTQGPDTEFSSQLVMTWNGSKNLLPNVSSRTTAKVVDVGLPSSKPDRVFNKIAADLKFNFENRTTIGVFENLHWTRYSKSYRGQFLEDLQFATDAFPDFLFVTKPHHEGRWLSDRFTGDPPKNDNLLIVDPKSPTWNLLTAPSLLPYMAGVVTTPSKVALDSSLSRIPTAVASYDGSYAFYKDLPALKSRQDWASFLEQIKSGETARLTKQTVEFVKATVSSIDDPQRVIAALSRFSPPATKP